jgi:hypothetical protein
MTEMSANTKYETLQVSKYCLEGMITIEFIVSLYNSFRSYLLHAGPWIGLGLVLGLESGSGILSIISLLVFIRSTA